MALGLFRQWSCLLDVDRHCPRCCLWVVVAVIVVAVNDQPTHQPTSNNTNENNTMTTMVCSIMHTPPTEKKKKKTLVPLCSSGACALFPLHTSHTHRHFGESNPHDFPALGSSDTGHMALSASSQFDNNGNAIPFSFLFNRSETSLPSLGTSFSSSINNTNTTPNRNDNLNSSFLNNQSPFGSSSSSSSSSSTPQGIFLPSPTPQLSSTRSPLAIATLPPFQFSPYGMTPSRSFSSPQTQLSPQQQQQMQMQMQQMSPQQLQQQMQMLAQMQMQMQLQMMGQQQQQQFNNGNSTNTNDITVGQFHPQQMMLQGPNTFGQMNRFTRDASPIDQPLSKSIYEPPQPFGQLFRPLNMSQCILPPGSFFDGSLDQRPPQQRGSSQLYSPSPNFSSERSPTQFNGPTSLPPFHLFSV